MVSIKSSLFLLVLEVDMFKWFKYLFHFHEWEDLYTYKLKVTHHLAGGERQGLRIYSRCKVCGKYKKTDLI